VSHRWLRLSLGALAVGALALGCGGGAVKCVPNFDTSCTTCVDGVVTHVTDCGSSIVIGQCSSGCKVARECASLDPPESFCNESPDAADAATGGQGGSDGGGGQGGSDGGGGQGGDSGCLASDNVATICMNGVLTITTVCPPSSAPAGTCLYGCKFSAQFGSFNVQGLCNPAPLDGGGCEDECGDAADSQ
jgi:hypothetical protein